MHQRFCRVCPFYIIENKVFLFIKNLIFPYQTLVEKLTREKQPYYLIINKKMPAKFNSTEGMINQF